YVVASCVRAERSVAMVTWNGSSSRDSEIFSTAGSSRPVMASASVRMTRSTREGSGGTRSLLRDRRDRRFSRENVGDIAGDEVVHRCARLGGGAGHVRHQHHVLEREQGGMNLRLFLRNLHGRPPE